VANADPGFPGVRLEAGEDVATLAESLRAGGYATYAVGKWHLARDENLAPGRPRNSWPVQRGFDRYYGSMEALNSFFHPNQLVADNSGVDIERYPDGYYVTDDLTDRAIRMITDLRAHDANRPFLLYFLAHRDARAAAGAGRRAGPPAGRYESGWTRRARPASPGSWPKGCSRPVPGRPRATRSPASTCRRGRS